MTNPIYFDLEITKLFVKTLFFKIIDRDVIYFFEVLDFSKIITIQVRKSVDFAGFRRYFSIQLI